MLNCIVNAVKNAGKELSHNPIGYQFKQLEMVFRGIRGNYQEAFRSYYYRDVVWDPHRRANEKIQNAIKNIVRFDKDDFDKFCIEHSDIAQANIVEPGKKFSELLTVIYSRLISTKVLKAANSSRKIKHVVTSETFLVGANPFGTTVLKFMDGNKAIIVDHPKILSIKDLYDNINNAEVIDGLLNQIR